MRRPSAKRSSLDDVDDDLEREVDAMVGDIKERYDHLFAERIQPHVDPMHRDLGLGVAVDA